MKKIVLALGGNALGDSPSQQKELVAVAAKPIAKLVADGYSVVIVHGNGPQVGMINNAFAISHKIDSKISSMPLNECVAMSQSYCGYHLQQALQNELNILKLTNNVVTIVSQTLVDINDVAFVKPSKPVGPFYTLSEADIMRKNGLVMIEDSGRGYREVVASPTPIDILEKESVKTLLNNKNVVICAGGGGIPVIKKEAKLEGVNAVIDKDSSAALIAKLIDADYFVILTAVDRVAINFGKDNQTNIDNMTVAQALTYIDEGQFPAGSMLPKVQAAINFVKDSDKVAIIASLERTAEAIIGSSGTKIINK